VLAGEKCLLRVGYGGFCGGGRFTSAVRVKKRWDGDGRKYFGI
jgi:hypothetical protein